MSNRLMGPAKTSSGREVNSKFCLVSQQSVLLVTDALIVWGLVVGRRWRMGPRQPACTAGSTC